MPGQNSSSSSSQSTRPRLPVQDNHNLNTYLGQSARQDAWNPLSQGRSNPASQLPDLEALGLLPKKNGGYKM